LAGYAQQPGLENARPLQSLQWTACLAFEMGVVKLVGLVTGYDLHSREIAQKTAIGCA
jgi:hypothetical protein